MSQVFFKAAEDIGPMNTQIDQITDLFPSISPVSEGDIVAIKIHPGELGNTTYTRPVIVKTVVDLVKEAGGIPFVTDSTVLYTSKRFNAADLLYTAATNGFTMGTMGAPFICADGLRGDDSVSVDIGGEVLDSITVASAIANADSMIVISHCKGHPASGFGAAVKNLGMGCLDKAGKTVVHKVASPAIDVGKCVGCGKCVQACPWDAVSVNDDKASVNYDQCRGELSCLESCNFGAIVPPADFPVKMQARLGEAAYGPVKLLPDKIGYINWIFDLTPGCDCFNFSSPVFAGDVGITASKDPVALDKASLDLVNERMKHDGGSCVNNVWGIDPMIHLEYAEKIGAGSMKYYLVRK
ncbi:DUF362 domain-containing protein [Methanolobus sediminis]|uniref:DUF362 domain-containing protein n=1 Tax=Methanolobus sediminis TaxID=3072978 RepID=A0AA51UJQ2_9EURY|nr:DUF362 domain-containing protein [Methanolobus sediminis]WMW24802.1 DUF362 domain-containing protein [Methanolobus sediminis]